MSPNDSVPQPTLQLIRPSYDSDGRMVRTDTGFATEEKYVQWLNSTYVATAKVCLMSFADISFGYTAEDLNMIERRLILEQNWYVLNQKTVYRAQVAVFNANNEPTATAYIGVTNFNTVAMLIGVGEHIIDPFDCTIVWSNAGIPATTRLLTLRETTLFELIRASCMRSIL